MASTPTTTRRALALGGGAFAAVGVTAGAAAMTADRMPATLDVSPDAELLALGAQLVSEEARYRAWGAATPDCSDDELDAAAEPCSRIVHQIEHMEAHSLEGMVVKARAISWCNSGQEIDPDRFCPYPGAATNGRIAASIVRDLLRRV